MLLTQYCRSFLIFKWWSFEFLHCVVEFGVIFQRHHIPLKYQKKTVMLHGLRTQDHILSKIHFENLKNFIPNFTYFVFFEKYF